jgi:iron complex outermembrane receptor protein
MNVHPSSRPRPVRPGFLLATSALVLLTSVSLRAQATAGATPSKAVIPDESVELSPFEVTSERDDGYQAANTLGATRTNVAIRDLPMQMNVVNEQP